VRRDPEGLGLDGVSLGGLWSLVLGLTYPERVGQIGALQPAVTPWIDELATLAVKSRDKLRRRRLSLVTSSGDGLRPAVTRLSARLAQAGVRHTLTVLTGPHDYVFNRGPGALHMLLWHDRGFRGFRPP
jgi:enterochelin esterase-like enzyme